MDPNATLRTIRNICDDVDERDMDEVEARAQLDSLRGYVGHLDEWLSNGGFLPEAWRNS